MMAVATERLDWLKQQINQGWRVQAPVLERTRSYGSTVPFAYEFVLRQEHSCQVVAVPDCPELQQFMDEHAFAVVSL